MFGIGPLELVVIAIVAVVFIGPERLPDAMRKFGKLFVQVRRHANDVKNSFQEVIHDAERELELEKIRELQAKLQASNPTQMLEAAIHGKQTTTIEAQTVPPELGVPASESYDYHDSHYEDGTYKHHNPDHQPLTPDPFAHLPIGAPVPANPALTAPPEAAAAGAAPEAATAAGHSEPKAASLPTEAQTSTPRKEGSS